MWEMMDVPLFASIGAICRSAATVSELATRIKALKAAHTIEGVPQRIGKRRLSAEEPVTARIRRRMEAILDPSIESAVGQEEGASLPPKAP
jgi:hypothetical protein